MIQASKVKNFLGAISIIYAEFSPGSVKEIRIQNSGRNGRITLFDEEFTTSIIEKKLSQKYSVVLERNDGVKILLLNERVLGND